jgi:hypothetical protein
MKPSYEWTEEDVRDLIKHQINESSSLEYKACDALRATPTKSRDKIISEVSKDVSSFANANGGTIIYGVTEKDHYPRDIDENPFDPNVISKEWLEDIIDSNIKKKINGIRITPIYLINNKVLYVVYIPQSLTGPHQANDFRYYQRRNFKAEPMEDYQVRDVMNRFNYPILEPKFKFTKSIQSDGTLHIYEIRLSLINKGNVTANNFGIDLYFPASFMSNYQTNYHILLSPNYLTCDNIRQDGVDYIRLKYRNYGSQFVLFPNESFPLLNDKRYLIYKVNEDNYGQLYLLRIKWILYADSMPPKNGEIPFRNEF